ncbi:glycosyltransferase family 2 protein [Pedobacter psychrodurus]|uniref:glycosyltransferase family 2 protein n=1 Tax=Pedobacter psychrodurus TaxID=2530456 RepID=UPI00292D6885|nr:glycosyltransferase family 2 protein [Pedobacter psychrodurus]
MKTTITILMATYNGSAFLSEQLESIISQTYTNWELYIRDDQSTDQTRNLLEKYAAKDSRIKILELEGGHGSPVLNFGTLFNYIGVRGIDYMMFADQDDIWCANKVEASLAYMQLLEQAELEGFPILVYTKFQFVDEMGIEINEELSMPATLKLPVLLFGNYAYGCTMMLNKALINQINIIPSNAVYHDYWIALVACSFGKAILLPQKLLAYRQHSKNFSTNLDSRSMGSRFKRYLYTTTQLPALTKQYQMMDVFFETYKPHFNKTSLPIISGFLTAMKQSNRILISFMLRHHFKKVGLLSTVAQYYLLLRLRKKIKMALNQV